MPEQSIQMNLFDYFKDNESFTIAEANEAVLHHYNRDVKVPSIRARIYEGIDKGLFKRVAKGVYTVTRTDEKGRESTCMLINGNGRDLSFIASESIDAIVNDHPYALKKSHVGGNRNLVDYDCFQYETEDFRERFRILKAGGFMVEMLPERNDDNIEYVNNVIKMAKECNYVKEYVEVNEHTDSTIKSLLEGKDNKKKKVGEVVKKEDGKFYVEIINEVSGFDFYSVVPWKKGNFVINQGRKAKNTEDIYFFTKGKARDLKLDNKKNLALAQERGISLSSTGSYDVAKTLEENGIIPAYMSGTNGMLPVTFNHQPASLKEKIHKAEKPIDLYNEILSFVTLPGEKVLDQFAGSGNLGIAAVQSGRDAILIEKDEETFAKMKANVERSLGIDAVEEKYESMNQVEKNNFSLNEKIAEASNHLKNQQDHSLSTYKTIDDMVH